MIVVNFLLPMFTKTSRFTWKTTPRTFRSVRHTRDENPHVPRQTAQLPRYRLGLLPGRKKPGSVSPLVMQPKESFRLMSLSSEFGSGTRKRQVRAIGL